MEEPAVIKIAPSILSADFARLGEQVKEVERGGADRIHVDVMDGHFVPNLSMGPVVVQALRPPVTQLLLEVHLMIDDPIRYAEPFLLAGANTLIAHLEVLPDPRPFLQQVRARGCKAGLAINPDKPIDAFGPYLADIDLALCMTVFPGFGGQAFIAESVPRIRQLRQMINRMNPACDLEVDGGIDPATAELSVNAGANVLVAGTSVFRALGAKNPAEAVQSMRQQFTKPANSP
jgi:ribulose-phosphate 3-epimerase